MAGCIAWSFNILRIAYVSPKGKVVSHRQIQVQEGAKQNDQITYKHQLWLIQKCDNIQEEKFQQLQHSMQLHHDDEREYTNRKLWCGDDKSFWYATIFQSQLF